MNMNIKRFDFFRLVLTIGCTLFLIDTKICLGLGDPLPAAIQVTEWSDFIWYNRYLYLLWSLCGAIVLLIFIISSWLRNERINKQVPIVPQTYPPEGVSASAARYVIKKQCDATVLAAEVVSLAARGFLVIEYDTKSGYSLVKTERSGTPIAEYEEDLLKIFFLDSDRVSVARNAVMGRAARYFNNYLANRFNGDFTWNSYFVHSSFFDNVSAFLFIFGVGLPAYLYNKPKSVVLMTYEYPLDVADVAAAMGLLNIFLVVVGVILYCSVRDDLSTEYTSTGSRCKAHIDGFKMFLQAAEGEGLHGIDTVPDKTVQLYENYLPYAVALGVVPTWTEQFTALFEQLERAGTPYVFVRFKGDASRYDGSRPLGSGFYRAFKTAIPASTFTQGLMEWYWWFLLYWFIFKR